MKRFSIIISVAFLLIPGFAYGALSSKDDAALTSAFERISTMWVQEAGDSATSVLCKVNTTEKPIYSPGDWEIWFNKFFNTDNHPYTDSLANYLANPIFGWCNEATRLDLQMGLINALWTKINDITSNHPTDLGIAMYNDTSMRQTLFNGHSFFALLVERGAVDVTTRTNIYINYKNYIKTYLQYFSAATLIDKYTQPFVALLRAQVWISFGQILPLDTSRKGEIATTIGIGHLVSKKLDLWNDFTVLVIDNDGLDLNQLNVIYNLLSSIPSGLNKLKYVTVRDFFSPPLSSRVILSKGEPINYYLVLEPDNTVRFAFQNTNKQIETFRTQSSLAPNEWNHVAVTFDGSAVSIYINGLLHVTYISRGLPDASSLQPLELGRRIKQLQWMRGKLDEVKIYNRALSGPEIGDEYKNKPISSIGLVAYYKMNELRGSFVEDSSGLKGRSSMTNGSFFNGKNDFVEVPDSPALRLSGSMTVEAQVYFTNEEERWVTLGGSGGVNIFGGKVGTSLGNPFPPDISPVTSDGFSETAVHEFNHVVDGLYVAEDSDRKAWRERLLTQAGTDPLQYLRSMFVNPDGTSVFPQGPQEFFASISNQYFTDSWHSFDLALQRFNKGYREPINQFLFFADIYSKGGLTTKFYTYNNRAVLTVKDVPIYRDLFGHIMEVTRVDKNTIYRFILDYKGNVLYYRTLPATKS